MRNGTRGDGVVAGDHHDTDAGRQAFGDCRRDLRTQRVRQAQQADEFEVEIVLGRRPILTFEATFGHRQHAQPVGGQRVGLPLDARPRRRVEVAQVDHRLRRPFGRDDVHCAFRRRPHMRHRAQLRAQRVGLHQAPVAMQVFGLGQELRAELVERLFHRIERIDHAGQDGHLDQRVKGLGQFTGGQRRDGHAHIQRQAAGHQV